MPMLVLNYQRDALRQLRKYRELAEKAMMQISDQDFFAAIDAESNSIAVIVKHMAGNMRSRWTDFLTTDGEKSNRNRDGEFVLEPTDTRESLRLSWNTGWDAALAAVEALQPTDFERTVTIRGEPHSILEAINRQVTHYAYHVGQIVLLAKHHAGREWQSLSIPRGQSREFDVSKQGETYRA
jgi:hypothetical protein